VRDTRQCGGVGDGITGCVRLVKVEWGRDALWAGNVVAGNGLATINGYRFLVGNSINQWIIINVLRFNFLNNIKV